MVVKAIQVLLWQTTPPATCVGWVCILAASVAGELCLLAAANAGTFPMATDLVAKRVWIPLKRSPPHPLYLCCLGDSSSTHLWLPSLPKAQLKGERGRERERERERKKERESILWYGCGNDGEMKHHEALKLWSQMCWKVVHFSRLWMPSMEACWLMEIPYEKNSQQGDSAEMYR